MFKIDVDDVLAKCHDSWKLAFKKWTLKLDGCDGAIGGILEKIPWGETEQKYLSWGNGPDEMFDTAIGSPSVFNVDKLVNGDYDESIRLDNWAEEKVNRLSKAYREVIEKVMNIANSTPVKYFWVCESDDGGFKDKSAKLFDTQEECYMDMMDSAVNKMKWNIDFNDVTTDVEGVYEDGELVKMDEEKTTDKDGHEWEHGIHYQLRVMPHKIIHSSYSGTYTYEIKVSRAGA